MLDSEGKFKIKVRLPWKFCLRQQLCDLKTFSWKRDRPASSKLQTKHSKNLLQSSTSYKKMENTKQIRV